MFLSFGQKSKPVLALAAPGAFALVFAFAHFTYRWLELPAIRWGKTLHAKWQQPRSAAIPLGR